MPFEDCQVRLPHVHLEVHGVKLSGNEGLDLGLVARDAGDADQVLEEAYDLISPLIYEAYHSTTRV